MKIDLADAGVDLGDRRVLRERSWYWLEGRILGLLDAPPIGYVEVAVPGDPKRARLEPLYRYRVQRHFYGT